MVLGPGLVVLAGLGLVVLGLVVLGLVVLAGLGLGTAPSLVAVLELRCNRRVGNARRAEGLELNVVESCFEIYSLHCAFSLARLKVNLAERIY